MHWIDRNADFVVVPAMVGALLAVRLTHPGIGPEWLAMALGGFVAWTLFEYLAHRFAFHGTGPIAKMHDRHHTDEDTLASAVVSLAIISTLSTMMLLWLPWTISSSTLVGFLAGYTFYIERHAAFHERDIRQSGVYWRRQWRRHMIHHAGIEANYGVSSSIWDWVFGTMDGAGGRRS